ncbi:methylthioribulose 1-phosphate dehydratase [Exiguobacterium sp. s193]|uniref:methylthioribulose 1-phosphate dehydratase n=1 Tax=Exiguobacterium sp. s193 TaxID=2751207 RepID=UPI001BE6D4E8|nr:methylthioribulose 1-phosphate dehydratase [Exiguobacterium sp. s193]
MTFLKRYEELRAVKQELAARDWFPGTSGNLAIRTADQPTEFLVTASGKDKRQDTPDDFVHVDASGQLIGEQTGRPSAETLLHVEVFNRTTAGCSLHVHTIANNVLSELYGDRGEIRFSGQEIIKALGRWEEDAEVIVPIIENHADIPTLATAFSKHVTANQGAVLIRNHGITVWAPTAFEAKKHLEAYEFLFNYTLTLHSCRQAIH